MKSTTPDRPVDISGGGRRLRRLCWDRDSTRRRCGGSRRLWCRNNITIAKNQITVRIKIRRTIINRTDIISFQPYIISSKTNKKAQMHIGYQNWSWSTRINTKFWDSMPMYVQTAVNLILKSSFPGGKCLPCLHGMRFCMGRGFSSLPKKRIFDKIALPRP